MCEHCKSCNNWAICDKTVKVDGIEENNNYRFLNSEKRKQEGNFGDSYKKNVLRNNQKRMPI